MECSGSIIKGKHYRENKWHLLVSTYIVCERLSVMQRQARLPEIFHQIAQFTPVLEFGSRPPPPPPALKKNWVLTFQNTPHPIKNWNLGRSWQFGFWISRTPPPPIRWQLQYVETNRCIPQGHHLVVLVGNSSMKAVLSSSTHNMPVTLNDWEWNRFAVSVQMLLVSIFKYLH